MKKKIKDLTDNECKKICESSNGVCENCPLDVPNFPICMADLKNIDIKEITKKLSEEVSLK